MALASVANTTAAPREPPPNEILELVAHGRARPRDSADAVGSTVHGDAVGSPGGGSGGRVGGGAASEVRLTASELLDALGRHAIAACPGLSTSEAVAKMWGETHACVTHTHPPPAPFSSGPRATLARPPRLHPSPAAPLPPAGPLLGGSDPPPCRCRRRAPPVLAMATPGTGHRHESPLARAGGRTPSPRPRTRAPRRRTAPRRRAAPSCCG